MYNLLVYETLNCGLVRVCARCNFMGVEFNARKIKNMIVSRSRTMDLLSYMHSRWSSA